MSACPGSCVGVYPYGLLDRSFSLDSRNCVFAPSPFVCLFLVDIHHCVSHAKIAYDDESNWPAPASRLSSGVVDLVTELFLVRAIQAHNSLGVQFSLQLVLAGLAWT